MQLFGKGCFKLATWRFSGFLTGEAKPSTVIADNTNFAKRCKGRCKIYGLYGAGANGVRGKDFFYT